MWWKLVSSEVCGVDADPHLVQLSCGEGTAGLRLCYWRSYGAGRDIYCLREGFHASLNLNSGHGGPFFPFFCAGAFLLTVHYFICIVFMQRNVQVKLSFIPLLKN